MQCLSGSPGLPLLALGVPETHIRIVPWRNHDSRHRTGPVFFTEHPDIIYGLFISIIIANIIMAPLGIFTLRYMKTILSVPEELLAGIILAFCCNGCIRTGHQPV